jgi:Uma2 family endonuclease
MSEPAISLDDVGYQNLRAVADRLLETTRVEYVDEGVLLIMNPPGIGYRRIARAVVDDAKWAFYGDLATLEVKSPRLKNAADLVGATGFEPVPLACKLRSHRCGTPPGIA